MDGIKVTAVDRLKNRFKLWLREKLYELPTAHHLKQGLDPGMVHALNSFFSGRDLSMYLPYEVYTEEGLFKNEESYAFGLEISSTGRMGFKDAEGLQIELLSGIPKGLFIQFQVFTGGAKHGYRSWLTVTGALTHEVRMQLIATREKLIEVLSRKGLLVDGVDPQMLLGLLSGLLDVEPVTGYDDELLVKTQAGVSRVDVRNGRLMLSKDGVRFRDLIIYQARRFGVMEPVWIRRVLDALVNDDLDCTIQKTNFFISLNFRQGEEGVEGQLLVMEMVEVGAAGQVEAMLLREEWLIELDRFSTHLSWLSLMPFGVGPMVFSGLEKQRRWNPIGMEIFTRIIPLPYKANAVESWGGAVANG